MLVFVNHHQSRLPFIFDRHDFKLPYAFDEDKGGRITCLSGGYVGIHMPEHPSASKVGYVYEHTLVAEKMLGRSLTKDENVHHIDLDKHNNTPKNLFVCTHREHAICHRSIEKLIKPLMDKGIIKFDNGEYTLTI